MYPFTSIILAMAGSETDKVNFHVNKTNFCKHWCNKVITVTQMHKLYGKFGIVGRYVVFRVVCA